MLHIPFFQDCKTWNIYQYSLISKTGKVKLKQNLPFNCNKNLFRTCCAAWMFVKSSRKHVQIQVQLQEREEKQFASKYNNMKREKKRICTEDKWVSEICESKKKKK